MTPDSGPMEVIVPMTVADLPAVARIEALSEPRPWPVSAHRRELETNPNAAHFVARLTGGAESVAFGRDCPIVGFAAMWMQTDEAHVTMIAVDPAYRRRRIGLRLLVRLIDEAIARGARMVTLEVRVSNAGAARMYDQFGFAVVGHRRGYYADSGEDAAIMSTPDLSDPAWCAGFARIKAEAQKPPS